MIQGDTEVVADFAGLPDRYRLVRLLGSGSQKRVFLAVDQDHGDSVVVAHIESRDVRAGSLEVAQEVAALARVGSHPHILGATRVLDAGEHVFLVMPYMERGDLARRIEAAPARRLSIPDALEFGMQLCAALGHAHDHGITHGDVKPANLLLDSDDHLRLGDFGFAQPIQPGDASELRGTLAYLSPEQIRGEASGSASDLYALGCVLYEMLTGAPPFRADTAAELLNLHQLGRARDVCGRRPSVPVAVGLAIEKLLEKDPSARPAHASEVGAALDGALRGYLAFDEGEGAASPGRLVGRDAELAMLEEALVGVREGHPGVALVHGEAGIGKTGLLGRAMGAATRQGTLVLYGVCGEDRGLPHRPFVDALRPLAAHLGELPEEHAARIREFLYLVPEAARRLAPEERGVDQKRLFVSILSALSSLSQTRPIALVIEDLHQADSATLDLFEYLAFAIGDRAERERLEVLLVGSFRTADSAGLQRLAENVGALQRGRDLPLEPLREGAVIEVLRARGIENPSRQLAEELCRASGGNPLFVGELLEHLVREQVFDDRGGYTTLGRPMESIGLPATLMDALLRRVEGVETAALQAMRLMALLGGDLDLRTVTSLERGRSPLRSVLAGVEVAVASGVLERDGQRLRFAHPLMREVLANSVDGDERKQLHRWLADHWLAAHDREDRVRELEVARHLMQAGELAEPGELSRYAKRAAEYALDKFAWVEAGELLQTALGALDRVVPREDQAVLRAELHRKAGFAYFRHLDPGPCLHHYEQAAATCRERGDAVGHARALNDRTRAMVWLGMNQLSDPADAQPLIDALGKLREEPKSLRAEILSTLAEHAWSTSDAEGAEAYATRAMELTEPTRDHLLRAEISINLGLAQHEALRTEEALQAWRLGALHGRRAEDLSSTARCLQRAHMALFCLGSLDDALREGENVASMNRVLQLPGEAAITHGVSAAVNAVRGEFRATERHAGEALDLVRRAKYPWAMMLVAPVLAYARAMGGDSVGAHAALDALVDPKMTFTDSGHFAGLAYSSRWLVDHCVGEPVRITEPERDLLAESVRSAPATIIGQTTACLAIEVAAATQDARLAAEALPLVKQAAGLGSIWTLGWPFHLPRLVGVAATLAGDWDLAPSAFSQAIELTSRAGARAELGRTKLDLAQLLALRNERRDRERALALALEARAELTPFSESAFAARAEKLCSYLGR